MRKRTKKISTEGISPDLHVGYSAFDIVGDLAIIKVPSASLDEAEKVAEAIMKRHKNVKAVFVQETGVHGNFRLRSLKNVLGEKRTLTVHKESGCFFKVDIEKCYFSPRLSGERMRLSKLVQPDETVVNMFSGVGCFSLIIAKKVSIAKVYSIDINPIAFQFMKENIKLNRAYGKVIPILGDSKTVIEKQLQGCADRVLMPLPERAFEYLPCAVSALKPSGGWVHVHIFEHANKTENAADKTKHKVIEAFKTLGAISDAPHVRVVRSTGPNWWQLVVDAHILGKASFNSPTT